MALPRDPWAGGHPIAPLSCGEVGEAEPAYVWGALGAEARDRVDRHRAECRACDERLAAAERVLAQVDRALPRVAPPAELRARLLGAIARTAAPPEAPTASAAPAAPQRGHAAPPAHGAGARPSLAGTRPGLGRRQAPRWVRRPHRVPRFFAGVATGLVGAACALALGWLLMVRSDISGLLLPTQSGLAGADPATTFPVNLSDVARPAPHTLLDLRAPSGAGRGVVMLDEDGKSGVVLVREPGALPGAPYQVWLIRGDDRLLVGSFTLDARGVGTYVLPNPLPLAGPQRIEVQPPAGGSPWSADF